MQVHGPAHKRSGRAILTLRIWTGRIDSWACGGHLSCIHWKTGGGSHSSRTNILVILMCHHCTSEPTCTRVKCSTVHCEVQHCPLWSAALSTVGAPEVIVVLGRNPIFIPTSLWLAKFPQTFQCNQHIFFHHIVTAFNKLSHPANGGSMIFQNIGTNSWLHGEKMPETTVTWALLKCFVCTWKT
jgi:hypothetical protein